MIFATLEIEESLWQQGFQSICGIDEVGRGCFAGPVVAGAVVFPPNFKLNFPVADSKLLKPKDREEIALRVKETALFWAIGEVSVEDINIVGIGVATQNAYLKAITNLASKPDYYLIDAFFINALAKDNQKPIKGGDKISASIAAASIIAKVYRDELMGNLDSKYPGYGFSTHKGYGTKLHQQAIKRNGLSEIHRKSFDLSKFLPQPVILEGGVADR